MHIFFTKEGTLLVDWKIIKIYEEGLRQGIFISIRFLVLVLMTSILTLTTSPISITDGMEDLLNPFKRLKLPVHELALMMSISLRFIPTLMDETDKILKAQLSRGSDISTAPLNNEFARSSHFLSHSLSVHLNELRNLRLQWRSVVIAAVKDARDTDN